MVRAMTSDALDKPSREQLRASAQEPTFPPLQLWVALGTGLAVSTGVAGYRFSWGLATLAVLAVLAMLAWRWMRSRGFTPPQVDWNAFAFDRTNFPPGWMLWAVVPVFAAINLPYLQNTVRDSPSEPAPLWITVLTTVIAGLAIPWCARWGAIHTWTERRMILAKLAEQEEQSPPGE